MSVQLLAQATPGADSTTDSIARVTEGGASVVLLGVAAASIYALINGKIVPISAFERRLERIETALSDLAAADDHNHKTHDRLMEQVAGLSTKVDRLL